MPPRTNPFQQLVHLIEHQLASHRATVTESKEFVDQVTGQKREVDIAIETKVGTHPFVFGIECIDRGRPADVTWIEQIAGKHQDLVGVNKAIAVARNGFTKPALIKATQRKMDAFALGEANEADWVKYTNRLSTLEEVTVERPRVSLNGLEFHVDSSSPPAKPGGRDNMVYDAANNPVGNVGQIVDGVVSTDPNFNAHIQGIAVPDTDVAFKHAITFLDGYYYVLDESKTRHRLAQIVLKGDCRLETSIVHLSKANYGTTSVLHGAGEVAGQSIQVAWTEREDSQLVFGASFGGPGNVS
jgi:hypothetical protein